MAKTATRTDELRKGDKVVATVDLRDVPLGTEGKVAVVNGLTWIRYWVRFANGVSIGSLSRKQLATTEQWKRKLAGGADEPSAVTAGAAAGDGAAAEDSSGGVTTANGTLVPQKLIDRANAARARLAA
ncbi:MAG: hypothetical protein JWN46_875 [Acidimicrobiales bacterium]|nr:hypothetical protein [Acidimicrobiales bacterium]